ncbi:MAG TPA: DUF4430 domain-containing protein [Solirubrobacterales bacterium]
MRTTIAAFTVALLFNALAAVTADAAPTEVNVRIEGRSETLFEGPILTDGHNVRASSDAKAPPAGRRCNGLNNGKNPTPGPTPTAASVDAMSIVGEDFDGKWYAEPFEDYFLTRWGPDGQNEGNGEYWGLLVNNVFTNVGGCQYELDAGDEVVWVYDAFKVRPILALFPADYTGGSRPLTATAVLHQPFEVEVDVYEDDTENVPPASPQRTGTDPYEGAEVAPVVASAKGFERIDTADAQTVTSGADGRASIVFDEPGWHRIKATVAGAGGEEAAIRSNRLDVCVPDPPAFDCGAPPPDDLVREPTAVEEEEEEKEEEEEEEGSETEELGSEGPGGEARASGSDAHDSGNGSSPVDARQVRLQLPRLDRSRIARGLVKVSWRVLDPGVGIQQWTISSKRIGTGSTRFVTRASGTSGTSATLRLPHGATYRLQLTVTDVLGRSSTAAIGRVQVPG